MTQTALVSRNAKDVGDQAQALRGLMRQLHASQPETFADPSAGRPAAIAVTSGKGGVGKTNIALNLGIALARRGAATCVIDANFGLGNVDLLCGLNGYWNLSHVVTGARRLRDIVLPGPGGIDVIPGASGLTDLSNCPPAAQTDLFNQLREFEETHDFLIVDAAVGHQGAARAFLEACDTVLVVTTPEPTSIADAYSTIKALAAAGIPHVEVLINQCDSAVQARTVTERLQHTARLFLRADLASAGWLPRDPRVSAAVAERKPFILTHPDSPASTAIEQLAARLQKFFEQHPRRGAYFPRVQTHRSHSSVGQDSHSPVF